MKTQQQAGLIRYSSAHLVGELVPNSNGRWVRYKALQHLKRKLDAADERVAELEFLFEVRSLMDAPLRARLDELERLLEGQSPPAMLPQTIQEPVRNLYLVKRQEGERHGME